MMVRTFLASLFLVCMAPLVHADAIDDLLGALNSPAYDKPVQEVIAIPLNTLAPTQAAPDSTQSILEQETALQSKIAQLKAQLIALVDARESAQARSTPLTVATSSAATTTQESVVLNSKDEGGIALQSGVCALTSALSIGKRGESVSALQRYLVAKTYLSPDNISGYFGKLTEKAVQAWQKDAGVVSGGTPGSTGFGYVGKKSRAKLQESCLNAQSGALQKITRTEYATSSILALIDPTSDKESNLIAPDADPFNVRLSLTVQGGSFVLGDRIPILLSVLDPVPYTGARISFLHESTGGTVPLRGAIYLPVGFSGDLTHFLNSSALLVFTQTESGERGVELKANIEAPFRDPVAGNILRRFGQSSAVPITLLEDGSFGELTFYVNSLSLDDESGAWQQFVNDSYSMPSYAEYRASFSATTTSRSQAIERCDEFQSILISGLVYSCMWNDEELAGEIRDQVRSMPLSSVPPPLEGALGSYFIYRDGLVTGTNLAITRAKAFESCVTNHTENPSSAVRCVWNNEVIYDAAAK